MKPKLGPIQIPGIPSSAEVRRDLRAMSDTIILAFSCGKDSIAAWLALRERGFQIVPYYMVVVPDLQFVEESLDYFEGLFGVHIIRLLHPSWYRMMINRVFQPPERDRLIGEARIPRVNYGDIREAVIADCGLPPDTFVANGVRCCDSPMRRISLVRNGPINWTDHKVQTIWDWRKAHVTEAISAAGIRLPVDYSMFGRSFDGIDLRFLRPIKERFPADYRRILDWFPLAELELFRAKMKGVHHAR